MLALSFKPYTAPSRFKKLVKFVDLKHNKQLKTTLYKLTRLKTIGGKKQSSRRVVLNHYQPVQQLVYKEAFSQFTFIADFDFLKPFFKELVLLKDIYGRVSYKPALNIYYPGFTFKYARIPKIMYMMYDYRGYAIPLQNIPYYINFSYIFNYHNHKPVFCRSTGVFAYKKRDPLRSKLMYVIMPSGEAKYFLGRRLCYLGYIDSYSKEDIYFGK